MSLLPISLGVRRQPATGEAASSSRPRSPAQTEKILKRDDYTCRCCGFRARRYQRVVPASLVADSDVDDEFVTLCLFCEMCFTLDRAGLAATGILVWLPEISQADLHHIMRAIYVARANEDSKLAVAATRAFDALQARRAEAKKRLGGDDPLMLATVFQENMSDEDYARRNSKLDGIRLLPLDRYMARGPQGDANRFPQIVKYWTSGEGPYGKLMPASWSQLFDSVQDKLGRAH